MARRFDQPWIAGTFIQQAGRGVSSLAGLNVASGTTLQRLTGSNEWRGIVTMNSGTAVVSVSAAAVVSGSVISANLYMYASALSSQAVVSLAVGSVRAGAFNVFAVGSVCPIGNADIAWAVIR